jgi:hypothetical protein
MRLFYWWDDAVSEANRLARQTGVRHRVFLLDNAVAQQERALGFASRWCVGSTVAPR